MNPRTLARGRTARADANLDTDLSRIATASGRSKSSLIDEALNAFVPTEKQFPVVVEGGKQALREGRTLDHATVVAAFDRLIVPHAFR